MTGDVLKSARELSAKNVILKLVDGIRNRQFVLDNNTTLSTVNGIRHGDVFLCFCCELLGYDWLNNSGFRNYNDLYRSVEPELRSDFITLFHAIHSIRACDFELYNIRAEQIGLKRIKTEYPAKLTKILIGNNPQEYELRILEQFAYLNS